MMRSSLTDSRLRRRRRSVCWSSSARDIFSSSATVDATCSKTLSTLLMSFPWVMGGSAICGPGRMSEELAIVLGVWDGQAQLGDARGDQLDEALAGLFVGVLAQARVEGGLGALGV